MKKLSFPRRDRGVFTVFFSVFCVFGVLLFSCDPPTSQFPDKIANTTTPVKPVTPPGPAAAPSPVKPTPVKPSPPSPVKPVNPISPAGPAEPEVTPSFVTTIKGRLTVLRPNLSSLSGKGIAGALITSSLGGSVKTADDGSYTLRVQHSGGDEKFTVRVKPVDGYKQDSSLNTKILAEIARSSASQTVEVDFTLAYRYKTTVKGTVTRRDVGNPSNTWGLPIKGATISVESGAALSDSITDSGGHIKGPNRGRYRGRVSGLDVYHAGTFRLITEDNDKSYVSDLIRTQGSVYQSAIRVTEQPGGSDSDSDS